MWCVPTPFPAPTLEAQEPPSLLTGGPTDFERSEHYEGDSAKEALERRSRALFGEVVLRGPLPTILITSLITGTMALIGWILFGIDVNGQTVWSWLT